MMCFVLEILSLYIVWAAVIKANIWCFPTIFLYRAAHPLIMVTKAIDDCAGLPNLVSLFLYDI